jgi:ribonuclease P protein component
VPPLEPKARRPQPIEQSTDFERVLRTRSRAQTQHFAVHHLPDRPSLSARARRAAVARKLSTGDAPEAVKPVDELAAQLWAGAVVPKRHARRAVTRSLLKRQIRSAVERHADALAGGLWVVRLRAPFDKTIFPSAASDALKRVARDELEALFGAAIQAAIRPSVPRA